MENIKLNIDKNLKYVVACSFGPDSMALLNLAIENRLNIVVAHVNYRKREASVYEQAQLEKFCQSRGIKIYVLDLYKVKSKGNFQEWAREQRYQFFRDVAKKAEADAVLVAHQEDDLIETFLMQKKRGNLAKTPGISEKNELFGVKIIRPLLAYSKQQLKAYDDQNNVPYSIDESNLADDYERNRIRHAVVEKLTKDERSQLLREIKQTTQQHPNKKTVFKKQDFLNLSYEEVVWLIDFCMTATDEHRDLSEKYINEIKKAISHKTTLRVKITSRVFLELGYDEIYLINATKLKGYEFKVNKTFKNEFIDIDFSNGAEDRGISNLPEDFVLKNVSKNDCYIIKDYKSKVRRLFIDWKMPIFLREVWPGIYSSNGELLYIPRYRKDFKETHKSKFKIDTDYFQKF